VGGRAEDHQGNRKHQQKGVPLAECGDRKSLHPEHLANQHHRSNEYFTNDQCRHEPDHDAIVKKSRHSGNYEEETVDDRIKHFAEVTSLVKTSGYPSIHPIGDPEGAKQQGRSCRHVPNEKEPQKDREARQTNKRYQIGHRGDAHPADFIDGCYPSSRGERVHKNHPR
jgi:hypothetical protein